MKMTPATLTLLISLAINLVLVGLFAGLMLKQANGRPGGPEPRRAPAIDRLSDADRREIIELLRNAHMAATPQRTAHRSARQTLFETLETDPYNAEETKAAFDALKQADIALRDRLQQSFLDDLKTLSPDQRTFLAHRLLRRGGRDNRRRETRHER